ncbi:hypothetical protein [Streptomyces rubiginosohelvolus]
MIRLTLVHLTFLGMDKLPAAVEFSPGLTVIYGASDTGKSYVEEAVDYMLGASELKSIPEDDGYTRILLGLRVSDGRSLTLSRAIGTRPSASLSPHTASCLGARWPVACR